MTAAIIVAAGRGVRMGGPVPKQYRLLDDMPVIRHTLLAFLRHPEIAQVHTVIHPADRDLYAQATEGLALPPPVLGGATRQESVRFGLESLAGQGSDKGAPDKVIIHDAVRPFVEQATISAVIAALDRVPAVITGVSVPDTLKRCSDGLVDATVDRTGVWRAQTPQGFHFDKILRAHARLRDNDPLNVGLTDDSLVIENDGLRVAMIDGSEDNFKITTERDLARAEQVLRRGCQENRVGWGFDFSLLGRGAPVVLCDVAVPHAQEIARSRNADIALNAVADALLGTVGGAADGSQHFQPDMPGFRGGTSEVFLRQAVSQVAMRAGRIVHVGLTILAAAPDVTVHREAMIARLAGLLGVERERISLKQATSFQAGFYGRGDGIGAQCLVTTVFPGP